MSDLSEEDDGFRERVMSAVYGALARVEGVELIERNRLRDVDEDVSSTLLFFDGDVEGQTDRPDAWQRNPIFPLSYVCQIWGGIQGGSGNPGTLVNKLWRRTVRTIWQDPELRRFLAENGVGLKLTQAEFPVPINVGSKKLATFFALIELPFEFDPLDP
jgi:hypothetical protein